MRNRQIKNLKLMYKVSLFVNFLLYSVLGLVFKFDKCEDELFFFGWRTENLFLNTKPLFIMLFLNVIKVIRKDPVTKLLWFIHPFK